MPPLSPLPGRSRLTEFAGRIMYVLEGEMALHTDLYTPVRLKAGESVHLDGMMGHAYLKASEGPCKVLCVCTNEHSGGGLGIPALP
ncbi:cupin domain-containing protein [Pandoraea sp. NPDC087047]|uniref:cupin domain-containing protein n=1 Tax=Pandoraea sp. NPDC087047 TaxID=3364390 RepID=UPI00382A1B42